LCCHVFFVDNYQVYARNKIPITKSHVIDIFKNGNEFKNDVAKMPANTKFALLSDAVTIANSGGDCFAKVRLYVDEGDHYVFYKEYLIKNIK
jgi:hypothetical protein